MPGSTCIQERSSFMSRTGTICHCQELAVNMPCELRVHERLLCSYEKRWLCLPCLSSPLALAGLLHQAVLAPIPHSGRPGRTKQATCIPADIRSEPLAHRNALNGLDCALQAEKVFDQANQMAAEAFINIRIIAAFMLEGRISGLYQQLLSGPSKDSFKQAMASGAGYAIGQVGNLIFIQSPNFKQTPQSCIQHHCAGCYAQRSHLQHCHAT